MESKLALLVLGKPGIGKSTLVNGLIGQDVAKVSAKGAIATHGVTREVECYPVVKGNVTVEVWDTPGLLDPEIDSEKTLQSVRVKCSHVDLVLFCLNMNTTRIYEEGEETKMINMITGILGRQIWKKTIVALVQANMLIKRLECDHDDKEQLKYVFDKNVKLWKSLLGNKILVGDVKVVPVGYFRNPLLFPGDKKTWLSRFWMKAYKRLPEQKQPALAQINRDRLVIPSEASHCANEHTGSQSCDDTISATQTASHFDSQLQTSTLTEQPKMLEAPPIPRRRKHQPGSSVSNSSTTSIHLSEMDGEKLAVSLIAVDLCGKVQPIPRKRSRKSKSQSADYSDLNVMVGDLSKDENEHLDPEVPVGDLSKDEDELVQDKSVDVNKIEKKFSHHPQVVPEYLSTTATPVQLGTEGQLSNDIRQTTKIQHMKSTKNEDEEIFGSFQSESNNLSLPETSTCSVSALKPQKSYETRPQIRQEVQTLQKDYFTPSCPETVITKEKKMKKIPPPTLPKPKKNLVVVTEQSLARKTIKVGKLTPEQLNIRLTLCPVPKLPSDKTDTFSSQIRERSQTFSHQSSQTSKLQDDSTALDSPVSSVISVQDVVSEQRMPSHDADTKSISNLSSAHNQPKEVIPSTSQALQDVDYFPTHQEDDSTMVTLNITSFNISIDQIKTQPLHEQPIIVSESFFRKFKNTFYKLWKKVF